MAVINVAKHSLQLSKVLKNLLYEHRMNPSSLAAKVNLSVPTVHRLVTGKSTRPYRSSLEPIANYFEITVEQLLGKLPIPRLDNIQPAMPSKNRMKTIPIILWEGVNELEPAMARSENQVAVAGEFSDCCFGLIMNDSSMEPLFPHKTILIFDPLKNPRDRSYVLVKIDNNKAPIFRQLLIDVEHRYLKPLNPDLSAYKMRLLNKNDSIIACLFESRINHDSDGNFNRELTI
jgi:SOS-response transcriptional repressor LexA